MSWSSVISSSAYASCSDGATAASFSRCLTTLAETKKAAAISSSVRPFSRIAWKARNWSSGCSGALDVLGQAVLLGEPVCAHDAGHKCCFVHALLFHEQFQRPEPPPAGGDRVHAGLGTAVVQRRPHGDGAEQRPPRDVHSQFLDR